MAVTATDDPPPTYAGTVDEITRIYKSLPPRPSIEEVEAANSVIHSLESAQKLQLEEISKLRPPQGVPPELFSILLEVKKAVVALKSHEQRKEAAQLVELDRILQVFDGLIQMASSLVSGVPVSEKVADGGDREILLAISEDFTDRENSLSDDDLKGFHPMNSSKIVASSSGLNSILAFEWFNLMENQQFYVNHLHFSTAKVVCNCFPFPILSAYTLCVLMMSSYTSLCEYVRAGDKLLISIEELM